MRKGKARAEARALGSTLFRQRVVKAKKGKGSYIRRPKHSKNRSEIGAAVLFCGIALANWLDHHCCWEDSVCGS